MKNGLAFGLGLLTGGGAVALVANTILKQHYAQKADEEITACREAFTEESVRLQKALNEKEKAERKEAAAEAIRTYSPEPENAAQMVHGSPSKAAPAAKPETPKGWKPPYAIDPAIFDDPGNPNKCLGLNYYPRDSVITHSENDEPIGMDELVRMVGRDALTHFDDDEQDVDRVCIRNENWNVDYEICIQARTWSDVLKEKPWLKK